MKEFRSVLIKNVIIILAGSLIGLLALLAVHLLPVSGMQANVYWSLDMIEKEFTDEVLVDGYRATLTGNFTDCLMLEHAIYQNPEHSILEQVLLMYRGESYDVADDPDGWQPGQSLKDYLTGVSQPREVTYSRYWHGYLIVLKPLLMIMSVNTLRMLNAAVQLILLGLILISMSKRGYSSLAKAFLVSVPFMFFFSTFASLSLSVCLYIVAITLLIQMRWDDILYMRNRGYAFFFLLIGMATSYFDFLTYPLVTLGYPLCVYLYLHKEKFVNSLKKLILYSLQWGIGYVGMWAMKWIYTDILTDSSTVKDALSTVLVRTSSAENATRVGGFFSVVAKNSDVYFNRCYILLILAVALVFLTKAIKTGRKRLGPPDLPSGLIFCIVALYPFAWYLIMQNHSEQHWQFTCRILSITVFAVIVGINKTVEKEKT